MSSVKPTLIRVSVLGALCSLLFTAGAGADGDPASDYLLQQDVFLPYPAPSAAAAQQLRSAVHSLPTGSRVKVAVIASKQDLGSVPQLFGQPVKYAKFLALEIAFVYKGPLLVAMPVGLGFYAGGAATAPAGIRVSGASADDLTTSAAAAVGVLARANELRYRDTTRPLATVAPETGAAGTKVSLRYQAWDDSGTARIDLRVTTAAGTPVTAFHLPFRSVREGTWHSVPWLIPARFAHKSLLLCAQATDPAGNRSSTTCAKLSVT